MLRKILGLREEKLAKKGEFPSSGNASATALPKIEAVAKPAVNLTAHSNTGRSSYSSTNGQSALDLIRQSRVGEVMTLAPVKTQIWVQIGAFSNETYASSTLQKARALGNAEISSLLKGGQTFYWVRLGPAQSVNEADKLLDDAMKHGFSGARIILD